MRVPSSSARRAAGSLAKAMAAASSSSRRGQTCRQLKVGFVGHGLTPELEQVFASPQLAPARHQFQPTKFT